MRGLLVVTCLGVGLIHVSSMAQSSVMFDDSLGRPNTRPRINDVPLIPPKPVPAIRPPLPPAPPAAVAGTKECKPMALAYKGNGVAEPPPAGHPVIWGGSATYSGNSAPLQTSFIKNAELAKSRGHHTAMYLEGPCGATGGSDPDNEIGKCRAKFQAYNQAHRSEAAGIADQTSTRWKPYTIAQLKASVKLKVDYCEIDNMDNSDGLISFMETYKTLFDRGEIYCKLLLKNVNVLTLREIGKRFKGQTGGVDFIAPMNIVEVGGNNCRAGFDKSWRPDQAVWNKALVDLKGRGAQTFISKDTCKYESANFDQDTVLSCGGGRSPSSAPSEPLVGDAQAGR